MQLENINQLKPGDVVRNLQDQSGGSFIVVDVLGDRATAVRTVDITNPPEWEVVIQVAYRQV